MKRNIIIDTDPGIDDAAALIIALRSEEFDVKLLSTVGANVEVEKTTANALKLVEFLGLDIPVAKGCYAPLIHKLEPCPEVHGISGLDGYDFPEPQRKPLDMHAVEAMRRTIMETEGKTTLVVIGTHTNIAILLRLYPEVKEKIDEIVTMGGGVSTGNTISTSEFNIYNDPHAASIVFNEGIPITMMGLNVTNRATVHRETSEKLRDSGRVGHMIYSLFAHYRGGSLDTGLHMHDSCAIAYLLRPDLFRTEMKHVDVVTEGPAEGATVVEMRPFKPEHGVPNVNVAMDIDSEGFEKWFLEEFLRHEN